MDKRLAPTAIEWLQKPVTEPRAFARATWRGTTCVCPTTREVIGVSLDTPDGPVRYLLKIDDAAQLAESIADSLAAAGYGVRIGCQSASSSGNPSDAVSTPEE